MYMEEIIEAMEFPKSVKVIGEKQVKDQFKINAKKYHPDKNRNNAEAANKFKVSTNAKDTLLEYLESHPPINLEQIQQPQQERQEQQERQYQRQRQEQYQQQFQQRQQEEEERQYQQRQQEEEEERQYQQRQQTTKNYPNFYPASTRPASSFSSRPASSFSSRPAPSRTHKQKPPTIYPRGHYLHVPTNDPVYESWLPKRDDDDEYQSRYKGGMTKKYKYKRSHQTKRKKYGSRKNKNKNKK